MKKLTIVYTVDGNDACIDQLRKSIFSVRHFLGSSSEVIVCSNEPESLTGIDCDRLIDVRDVISKYGIDSTNATWHHKKCSPMMLYRLAIPVTPGLEDKEKVLYLDSDTEIWSSRAADIADLDMEGFDLLGIIDHVSPQNIRKRVDRLIRKNRNLWSHSKRKESLIHGDYANSGVLLMDLSRMRRGDPEKVLKSSISHLISDPPSFPDQEIINTLYNIKVVNRPEFNWWPGPTSNIPIYIRHHVGGKYSTDADITLKPRSLDEGYMNSKRSGKSLKESFDKAFLICCTSSPERGISTDLELKRLGIEAEKIWQFRSPFHEDFVSHIPHTKEFDKKPSFISNWFGHYRAIKTAYELGCDHALIVEDDCRFLKDIDRVNKLISDLPEDYDLALLDHFYCRWTPEGTCEYNMMTGNRSEGKWYRFSEKLYSAACYLISRKFMERNIWLHESVIDPKTPHRMMRITDNWHNSGVLGGRMNLYFCYPNCAIQRNDDSDTTRLSEVSGINGDYIKAGILLENYEK